jgi:ABC-2 type transport system permease protein
LSGWSRIGAIASKEVRQLSRDRITFGMVVMIPLIQLLLFGYAINTDVRHISAAWVDHSNSSLSRRIVADVQASQVLLFRRQVATVQELEALIRRGEVSVGLYIPVDAERRMQQSDRGIAQLLVDGSDPVMVGAVAALRAMPVHLRQYPKPRAGRDNFELRLYYNPERRSAVNIVPGLVGVILTMTMVLFTAIAIVRERERGNLELLITTPVKTIELMLGKIIPYIFIGLVQASLILALGYWVFRVPVSGSLFQFYLAVLLFIAANLGLGLVISTLARSQLQAMQMFVFVLLPSILLSGFMFPFDGMPRLAQGIAQVLPLTHFVKLARGIILRGATLWEMPVPLGALAVFFLTTLGLAVLRFRKRLD